MKRDKNVVSRVPSQCKLDINFSKKKESKRNGGKK